MIAGSTPTSESSDELVLDQLALGRDQQHRHLETFAGRIQDLEIELDVVHVEGDVLLGLPSDDLARLRFLHAVHRDLLDDHVAAAHGGDELFGLDAGRGKQPLDRLGDDPGVHDFAFHDRVIHDLGEGDLGERGAVAAVRNRQPA